MKKRLRKRWKTVPNSISAYACKENCVIQCGISCPVGQTGTVAGTKTTTSVYAK